MFSLIALSASSATTAWSDERLPCVCSACRRLERCSARVLGTNPARGNSAVGVSSSSSSSVSTRKLGRTGVISKKPAARCHERAKLLILLTPPASPSACNCCETEDLWFFVSLVSSAIAVAEIAYLRRRRVPLIAGEEVPVLEALCSLGRRSSSSHCTRLPCEPTEAPRTPSYWSQWDGCLPLMSMVVNRQPLTLARTRNI